MAASEKLFTPREAAQVLGISYPTLKQWIYRRKIRTIPQGESSLISSMCSVIDIEFRYRIPL
jgi:excisionase family DNA binding protein